MATSNPKALRKLIAATTFLFRRGFNASKCKAEVKMATARIKLLRNKRQAQIAQMRRDIAQLLKAGQEDIARIRVEHVIREQNILTANEIIELFCDLIVARLPIITKERRCPADLKEGISSLIFAAPRCSEVPELLRISEIFEKKYGKDFLLAASELRPDSCVNRLLIEKLSVLKPSGEVKVEVMKAIAKECQVNWDPAQTEKDLLTPPQDRINGPSSFVSASRLPPNRTPYENSMAVQFTNSRGEEENHSKRMQFTNSREEEEENHSKRMQFSDTASAARAAAEFAAKAAQAARSAASSAASFKSTLNRFSLNRSSGYEESGGESEEVDSSKRVVLKFDDSDGFESEEEEIGDVKNSVFEEEKEYSGGSRVHPKMPDYEELTARFEKLRSSGSMEFNRK